MHWSTTPAIEIACIAISSILNVGICKSGSRYFESGSVSGSAKRPKDTIKYRNRKNSSFRSDQSLYMRDFTINLPPFIGCDKSIPQPMKIVKIRK